MRPFLFYAVAIMIVVCDQVSKWAIVQTYPYGASERTFIPFLWLTHTRNTGGAFSLLQARNHWFIVIAAVAMVALAFAYHRSARRDLWVSAALALALGGAIGNLIDRVRFGYVIDFFDVKVWPVFNVADSAITVGILILAWTFLFKREPVESGVQASGRSGVQENGDDRRLTTDDELVGSRQSAVGSPHETRVTQHSPESEPSAAPTPERPNA